MKLVTTHGLNRSSRTLFRVALKRLARSFEVYHPVAFNGRELSAGQRGCEDRWNLIRPEIQRVEANSLVDLGCAEGYFVRQAATDTRCVSLGIDSDVRRLMVAQTAVVLDGSHRAGFMLAEIDFDFLERLPVFDVVIYQSVMHHVMYEHGVEYARDMLRRIRAKTRKALIFDMGQSNETSNPWSVLLPDMGPDPHRWIQEFIESAGFSAVRKLGDTDAYRETTKRAVFVATP